MSRLFSLPAPVKSIAARLLELPVANYAARVATRALPIIQTLRYASWFQEQRIRDILVETPTPFGYDNRYLLYEAVSRDLGLKAEAFWYIELGVAGGDSLRWWLAHNRNAASRFVGFDTFSGLPDAWGRLPAGWFTSAGKAPTVDDPRCSFEVGPFEQTLGPFLARERLDRARTFVHLDADLYGSTLFALITLGPHLKSGDVLLFDELADGMNEFRAMEDALASLTLVLTPLRAVNWGNKIAFVVAPRAQR